MNAASASRRSRAACALWLALWLSLLSLPAAVAAEPPERETAAGGGLVLRYGWSADQTWRATHRSERETQLPVGTQRDRGIARFEYRVEPGEPEGTLRLEARLLSQETAGGASPLDFSPIAFRAQVDALGRLRGAHYQIGEAEPPVVDGARLDPIAFRHMLRQVASAWRGAVFWFPELPERALSPGDAFVVDEARDLAESEPGVKMQMRASRSYRLLGVESGVARFRVEETSEVDAATADSGIASEQRAEGEALFDLSLGMWTRHRLVSSQRASYQGAEGLGAGEGEVNVRSTTSLEMQRLEPETAPGSEPAP